MVSRIAHVFVAYNHLSTYSSLNDWLSLVNKRKQK
jgi:hypothetical protein